MTIDVSTNLKEFHFAPQGLRKNNPTVKNIIMDFSSSKQMKKKSTHSKIVEVDAVHKVLLLLKLYDVQVDGCTYSWEKGVRGEEIKTF
jgi:hypothetical protein